MALQWLIIVCHFLIDQMSLENIQMEQHVVILCNESRTVPEENDIHSCVDI